MRLVGLLLAVVGWLISVLGLTITQSLSARFLLALVGIGITLFGILSVLCKAHEKNAIWKA